MTHNAANLESALDWLARVTAVGLRTHFGKAESAEATGLALCDDNSFLPRFIRLQEPTSQELILMMLALAPHLSPAFFDKLISEYLPEGGDFPEFGGVKGSNHRGILPTGETAQFILAGDDLEKRLAVQRILSSEHWFAQKHILWLEPVREGEPAMSGRLVLDPEIVEEITTGTVSRPAFSVEFPAEHIETAMDWDDLVLNPATWTQICEIENWIVHHDTLLNEWGMKKRIKPGYRALFYGPPGTGKTFAATDPIRVGLVPSLSRPGGNITGVTYFISEVVVQRLQFLRELVPGASVGTIGFLTNPTNLLSEPNTSDMVTAAQRIGQQIRVLTP
jgi:hypothetical protein